MTNSLLKIGDIEKFSIVDFPSKIAAVVFMQGCPWRCPFCYNQSLQTTEGEESVSWDNLIHLLEHRKGILDAVVFSGGEPLLQENLPLAMDQVRTMGFEIGLHTGGFAPNALRKVIDKVIWVGFDIKAPFDNVRYNTATGSKTPVENIKESLDILLKSGINFECRTTCDPRILNIEDIYKMADDLATLGVKEYHLQKYRPIETDKITQEADCEKFFKDKKLIDYLKSKFKTFSTRE